MQLPSGMLMASLTSFLTGKEEPCSSKPAVPTPLCPPGMELDAFMAMNPTTNCTGLQPGDAVCVEAAPKPPPPPPRPSPSPPPSPRPPAPVSAPVPVPVPG